MTGGRRGVRPPSAPPFSPRAARASGRQRWQRWALLLLPLVAIAAARLSLRLCQVMSASMEPTLGSGDVVLVLVRPPVPLPVRRGQVVLASLPSHLVIGSGVPPGRRVLKRVAGVQGDLLEGRGGAGLFRNGTPVPPRSAATSSGTFKIVAGRVVQQLEGASWWHGAPHRAWLEPADDPFLARLLAAAPPQPLPPGTVFLLGDNPAASVDSRTWGPLPEACVEGWVIATVPSLPGWLGGLLRLPSPHRRAAADHPEPPGQARGRAPVLRLTEKRPLGEGAESKERGKTTETMT